MLSPPSLPVVWGLSASEVGSGGLGTMRCSCCPPTGGAGSERWCPCLRAAETGAPRATAGGNLHPCPLPTWTDLLQPCLLQVSPSRPLPGPPWPLELPHGQGDWHHVTKALQPLLLSLQLSHPAWLPCPAGLQPHPAPLPDRGHRGALWRRYQYPPASPWVHPPAPQSSARDWEPPGAAGARGAQGSPP